jgi:hypothetical protein
MMTLSTELLSPLKEQIIETNSGQVEPSRSPKRSVVEVVNEILGYDIFERWLIAEGAQEFAEESLHFAESTLDAGLETWPDE